MRYGGASNSGLDAVEAPSVAYLGLDVSEDGSSSLSQNALGGFELMSLGGAAAPLWARKFEGGDCDVWFTVLPIGWVGDWHESPAYQWVCALSGSWWIETADGGRVEMGPGEIHWGRDIGTRQGRGHRSGQIGSVPCVQMMVMYGAGQTEALDQALSARQARAAGQQRFIEKAARS